MPLVDLILAGWDQSVLHFHFLLMTQFVCVGLLETFAHWVCNQGDLYSICGTQLIEAKEATDVIGKWLEAIFLFACTQMHGHDCFFLNPLCVPGSSYYNFVFGKSMRFSYKVFHVPNMPPIPRMVRTYDPIWSLGVPRMLSCCKQCDCDNQTPTLINLFVSN
jgi:hypothetical protein